MVFDTVDRQRVDEVLRVEQRAEKLENKYGFSSVDVAIEAGGEKISLIGSGKIGRVVLGLEIKPGGQLGQASLEFQRGSLARLPVIDYIRGRQWSSGVFGLPQSVAEVEQALMSIDGRKFQTAVRTLGKGMPGDFRVTGYAIILCEVGKLPKANDLMIGFNKDGRMTNWMEIPPFSDLHEMTSLKERKYKPETVIMVAPKKDVMHPEEIGW